jgi:phosphocarrier protein
MPLERRLTIINTLGLHARCAVLVAEAAKRAEGPVLIRARGQEVDAASVLDILTLAAGKGDSITVHIKKNSDEPVLLEIAALVENGFGEQ